MVMQVVDPDSAEQFRSALVPQTRTISVLATSSNWMSHSYIEQDVQQAFILRLRVGLVIWS